MNSIIRSLNTVAVLTKKQRSKTNVFVNKTIYSAYACIHIRARKNSVFGHFSRSTNDFGSEIKGFIDLRKRFPYNPLMGYINVNSLKEKIVPLRKLLLNVPVNILCLGETKLDLSFPDHQFKIEGYQFPPIRRGRNSKGGEKLVYLREGFIVKRIPKLETGKAKTICIEITIAKKKWCILFAYRPSNFSKTESFKETSVMLNKALDKCDNKYFETYLRLI